MDEEELFEMYRDAEPVSWAGCLLFVLTGIAIGLVVVLLIRCGA